MEQRTCNIISCCKDPRRNAAPAQPEGDPRLVAVAQYMADECDCPVETYQGATMDGIMLDALYDYLETADHPGQELRRLFSRLPTGRIPALSACIASFFDLVQVQKHAADGMECVNGFTRGLLDASKSELAKASREDA